MSLATRTVPTKYNNYYYNITLIIIDVRNARGPNRSMKTSRLAYSRLVIKILLFLVRDRLLSARSRNYYHGRLRRRSGRSAFRVTFALQIFSFLFAYYCARARALVRSPKNINNIKRAPVNPLSRLENRSREGQFK